MASITSPRIDTQIVVTGTNYQLSISEASTETGITRIEIGPYYFEGASGQVKYPEAPTNEMVPSGWQQIHWITESDGSSWLRFEGGIVASNQGERIFQFTSNFPPSNTGLAKLRIWRGTRTEKFAVNVPDYDQKPPARNSRRDTTGFGEVYKKLVGAGKF